MAEFPTYEEMAKRVAEKALDEFLYQGKSIREWMKIIAEQEPCEDCISRQAVLDLFNKSDNYSWEMSWLKRKIEKIPPVTPQQSCEDAINRQAVLDCLTATGLKKYDFILNARDKIKNLPSVKPQEPILDKIEPKCDRVNSLASVLPYTAHREIQELLCEIMDLLKESEAKNG